MSLNALQTYLAGQLDGLTSGGLPPAQAWVLPPAIVQPIEAPQLFLWGAHLDEERYTLARGYGQKIVKHRLDLFAVCTTENDIGVVRVFPMLLDAVRAFLRSMPMPVVPITDPDTGEESVLQWIGENITLEYTTPIMNGNLLEHSAYFVIPADEILSNA